MLAAHFSDKEWVAKLAYLCNIFNLLNDLYLSLQGKMATVFKLADEVAEEENKLLEITNDGSLKSTFEVTTLHMFWIKVMAENPVAISDILSV